MYTRKKYSIAFTKYFSKIRANLQRHNRVYELASKHTYRPMSGRLVSQLYIYKMGLWPACSLLGTCVNQLLR